MEEPQPVVMQKYLASKEILDLQPDAVYILVVKASW
jgi:hypothetical protein